MLGLAAKQVADDSSIREPPGECLQDERYSLLADMPCSDHYTVHAKCICNQVLAAKNRVICDWPQPCPEALARLRGLAVRFSAYLGHNHHIVQPEIWTAKYSGYKQRRYERAIREWEVCGVNRKHSYINAFVKGEKITDPRKDPRMIQARNPVYNVALGNYLKAIEHQLYNISGTGKLSDLLPRGRIIAKGLNMVQRGALLSKRWGELKNPVALELDCSRFDAHCSKHLLEVEHRVYLRCFNNAPELRRLLAWQLYNKCFTEGGVVYQTVGRRMSGDMNTALGNCVIMVMLLADAFKQMMIPPSAFRIVDDGDDCVVLVESQYSIRAQTLLPDLFTSYGHQLKVDSVTSDFAKVTLCGSRVIRVGGVRTCILNPRRTIGKSRVQLGCKNVDPNRYIATVGQCLLALHQGVPVLQEHALCLRRASRRFLKEPPGSYLYRLAYDQIWLEQRPQPVTEEARSDFALSFGISIPDQLEIEEWFRSGDPFTARPFRDYEVDSMGVTPMFQWDGFLDL